MPSCTMLISPSLLLLVSYMPLVKTREMRHAIDADPPKNEETVHYYIQED